MTWNRASRQDYDDWRELGNDGWGWDDLLPFFKKTEHFHPPIDTAKQLFGAHDHAGQLGLDGPVQVSYPVQFSPSHRFWHRTMNGVGIESNMAHMAGDNTGCWTSLVSTDPKSGTRSYAAAAYYQPNASRPNLWVLTGAEVRETILERAHDGQWEAKGARFVHNGREFSVSASREVILSAGSVQSPQILELSGIGGSQVLSAAGIEVKVDNPNVGENLQDHMTTTMVFEVDPSLPTPDDLRSPEALAAAAEEYTHSRTGPFVVVPISMAYVPLMQIAPQSAIDTLLTSSPSPDSPLAEHNRLLRRRFSTEGNRLGHVEYVFDLGNWGPDYPSEPNKKYGSMLQILQFPFSRGSVHIQPSPSGSSLVSSLRVDPQYFSGDHGRLDLEIAVLAHRFSEKICAAQPLSNIIRKQVSPTPAEAADGESLREWLRRVLVTDWHPVGTCAMGGKQGARAGVVDERLRVYDVRGLRVADASIMPLQISAHLQATVYAIAEKAAHMILEDLDRSS
ncbi:hypothetical protein QBC47DRAFT_373578 [Echria macrotheca]|uniref:Glucose-methanol-choline oxidoreductase N-terminal domain-containing protein n=1 Tax=Echria macrotheca TaxID=438768 RepID=A0AAJ0BHI6_9PEZI|nr:hypothetical protein QBC47DRAFT_373578 [Echria macrotheca]